MTNDLISDTIIRLKNATLVKNQTTEVMCSKTVEAILVILKKEGFILKYELVEKSFKEGGKFFKVWLRYEDNGESRITDVKRISKPGARIYVGHSGIKKVLNGIGLGVYSTSQGLLTDKAAYLKNIGGEYLFEIW